MRATILGAIALGALGCGGGGLSTDFEGTYTIATWTENSASCDLEGASILSQQSDTAFYIETASIFGNDFINAVRCTDAADCATKQADSTIFLDGWAFDSGSDDKGWTGATTFAGVSGSMCTGEYTEHTLTGPSPSSVRIESRTQLTRPFPTDKDGFCNTDDAKVAAEGMPCSKLEVVTGTLAP
jgi:hypothetical protein